MARDGAGVYSAPSGTTVTTATTIASAPYNAFVNDLVADANTARPVVAGGTGATSASAARTNLAVPGKGATETITGAWTVSGIWTVSGAWTHTADVTFNDNVKAFFGTGSDLSIFHNGTNSFISDQGTGSLTILTNRLQVNNAAGTEAMLTATEDGAVTLMYDGAGKLTTAVDGVTVTGALSATTAAGAWFLDEDDMASNSATKVASQQSIKAYVDTLLAGYTSSAQTITAGGGLTLAHGLGAIPTKINAWLTNVTGEAGFTTGQRVPIPIGSYGDLDYGVNVIPDATNLVLRFGSYSSVFAVLHNTTGSRTIITPAKWTLTVSAQL